MFTLPCKSNTLVRMVEYTKLLCPCIKSHITVLVILLAGRICVFILCFQHYSQTLEHLHTSLRIRCNSGQMRFSFLLFMMSSHRLSSNTFLHHMTTATTPASPRVKRNVPKMEVQQVNLVSNRSITNSHLRRYPIYGLGSLS